MKIKIKKLKPRNYLVALSIKRKAGKHKNKKKIKDEARSFVRATIGWGIQNEFLAYCCGWRRLLDRRCESVFFKANPGLGIAFFGYAIGNVGLYLESMK